jgi:hypothetical protein
MGVVEVGVKSVRKLSKERGIMEQLRIGINPLFGESRPSLRYCVWSVWGKSFMGS